jgi:inorganic pyrophosphatase
MHTTDKFWAFADELLSRSNICIDRPLGSAHPRYPQFIYPLDYGYLQDSLSTDEVEVDIWVGSKQILDINGVVCTIDLTARDVEIKFLVGCTQEEIDVILEVQNQGTQAAFFIKKPEPASLFTTHNSLTI